MLYNLILFKKTKYEHDKWRTLVIAVTLIFCTISVILVVIDNVPGILSRNDGDCLEKKLTEIKPKPKSLAQGKTLNEESDCAISNNEQCEINCVGIGDKNIIKRSKADQCISDVFLILTDVFFTNYTIEEGWLRGFSKNITRLKIESKQLHFLAESSFSGNPFEILNYLTLANTNIAFLAQSSFIGTSLDTFEFWFNVQQEANFEFGALKHVADKLQVLQLNNVIIHPQGLKNLTGTLSKVLTIDLRDNSIDRILDDTFSSATTLGRLYLTSSQIEHMEKNAFSGIGRSVQLLFFDKNALTTLPEGIFDGFLGTGTGLDNKKIYIVNNRWNCDCNLQWFKTFFEENREAFFSDQQFTCLVNGSHLVDYSLVDFCPSTTAESSTSTTSLTTVTKRTTRRPTTVTSSTSSSGSTSGPVTTLKPYEEVIFSCENCQTAPVFFEDKRRSYSHTISVRNGSVTYDFYYIEGTPYYDLQVMNPMNSGYLIWINSKNRSDIGCLYNITSKATLKSLNYDQEYVICLLNNGKDVVSPFDCTTLVVPTTWDNKPWIFNKDKSMMIVLSVILILIMTITTVAVMYFVFRRNPKLVKAVNRENIGKEKEHHYIKPPSLYSTSDGYLSPRLYERIKSMNRRSRKLSTISESDSDGCFNVVYNVSNITEGELYQPPPLPPNHPSGWTKFELEDEISVYDSTETPIERSGSLKVPHIYTSVVGLNGRSKSVPAD